MHTTLGTIWVCVDCLFAREGDGTENPDRVPWNLIDADPAVTVTLGILESEHADGCTPADREEGCDCTRDHFSRNDCHGCGSTLAGEREAYTLWTAEPAAP